MSLMRSALLAGSQNAWLREHATRYPFVRRSVSRFMPGERLEDALDAARGLHQRGASSILTCLGENVRDAGEAEAVKRHYLEVLERVADAALPAQISVKLTQLGLDLRDGRHIDHLLELLERAGRAGSFVWIDMESSVKPTQLGLDLDRELCLAHLKVLVERAERHGNFVWIDMESSAYVDATLEAFRRARAASPRVGVALQAYLRRTAADLESLLPLDPAVRLVKGAYREPAGTAFPRKRDVDESYLALATRFLAATRGREQAQLAIATHDPRLVAELRAFVEAQGLGWSGCEFAMLYGIQRRLQARLLQAGLPLRVLISYGEYWFPWYMRRLAERPANVLFMLRSLLGG
jgi:proline dehydrogenase